MIFDSKGSTTQFFKENLGIFIGLSETLESNFSFRVPSGLILKILCNNDF